MEVTVEVEMSDSLANVFPVQWSLGFLMESVHTGLSGVMV